MTTDQEPPHMPGEAWDDGCCGVIIIGVLAAGLFLLGMIAIWNLVPVWARG